MTSKDIARHKQPASTGQIFAPLVDGEFLVALISEITGTDSDSVREKLAREHEQLGAAVAADMQRRELAPHQWSDRLVEFYEQTDAFLYETLTWNRTHMKQAMRESVAAFLRSASADPQRILVFGDGLGIDSLYLAEAGHLVDYYEVSERCVRFAKRLGETMQRELSIISNPADVVPESYDAVVCLDVLEHVPDPPEVAGLLASFLRPGGRLIVHAPFWYIHPNVATHLQSNVRYSGDLASLYRGAGLQAVEGEWFWNPLVLQKAAAGGPPHKAGFWARFKVALGGCLLRSARIWNRPHLWAFHRMFRRDRLRLRALAADLRGKPHVSNLHNGPQLAA